MLLYFHFFYALDHENQRKLNITIAFRFGSLGQVVNFQKQLDDENLYEKITKKSLLKLPSADPAEVVDRGVGGGHVHLVHPVAQRGEQHETAGILIYV